MTNKQGKKQNIHLDDLAEKYLSEKTFRQILLIDLEEKYKPSFQVTITNGMIDVIVITRIRIKKFLNGIGGIVGFLLIFFEVANWAIPIIESHYNKSPPLP